MVTQKNIQYLFCIKFLKGAGAKENSRSPWLSRRKKWCGSAAGSTSPQKVESKQKQVREQVCVQVGPVRGWVESHKNSSGQEGAAGAGAIMRIGSGLR